MSTAPDRSPLSPALDGLRHAFAELLRALAAMIEPEPQRAAPPEKDRAPIAKADDDTASDRRSTEP